MTALLMWSIVSKFKTLKQWFEFQSEVDRYISSELHSNFSTSNFVNVEDIISMTSQEIEKRKRTFSVVG